MQSDHEHDHERPNSLKNLAFAMIINGGIVAFEMIFGLLIQSMALISDAVHNLSDVAAMGFSYWAEQVGRRPVNASKTYGYRKIEFIAAFVNSIVLSVIVAFIIWAAVKRLISPPEIPGQEMLWVALLAFVGNGAATLILQKIAGQNFNMRCAWLHSLQDALFSLGVIVGAMLIMSFGWYVIDPLISIAISLFIAKEIYGIIRHTVNSLLDAVPQGIDFIEVRNDLLAIDGLVEVNDLHIWQSCTDQKLLSAHLRTADDAPDVVFIVRTAQRMLLHKYGINHATLQVLPCSAGEMEHCNYCN